MNEYRQILLNEIGVKKSVSVLTYTDWFAISCSGKLSEEFMREFQYDIMWVDLFPMQVLSDDFLIEIQEAIDWTSYFVYAKSSFSIIKKFITKADLFYFRQFRLSHFNKQQKNEIQKILDLKHIFQKNKIKLEKTI